MKYRSNIIDHFVPRPRGGERQIAEIGNQQEQRESAAIAAAIVLATVPFTLPLTR